MTIETYPQRQRCKTCRKKFGSLVLAGLYCSYSCGNFPSPAANVADAPRGCKREANGRWDYKTKFLYEDQVPEKYRKDASTNIYLCDNCRMYHIGHSRPETLEALVRYVNTMEELGSVVQRYRESLNISKKTLAIKLKIPAIRITELEEGSKKTSVDTLMKVLGILHLKISLASPPIKGR